MTDTVLVTGSSRGIGRAIALRLANDGYDVVVHCLSRRAGAEQVADGIRHMGRRSRVLQFDIGNRMACASALAEDIETNGTYYGVVCNAGHARDDAFPAMTGDTWDSVVHGNLDGFYNVLHPLVMAMVRRRAPGRIVTLSSASGVMGNRGQTNYSAAKAAIVGLTQTLSLELASIGATVNAISPGGRTRMSASMPGAQAPIEPDERAEDEFDPKDPSLGSPVVAWLASPEAGHVSGQVIRAMGEHLQLLKGWHPVASVSNGEKRWDAEKLGAIMATDVFGTRNTGLRLGG